MRKKRVGVEVGVWVITLFVALVCLRSGLMKMPGIPGVQFWMNDFARWGYPHWFRVVVGGAELVSFALLLVPRLAAYGASLFGIIMVGAFLTHITHNERSRLPFILLLIAFSLIILVARRPILTKELAAKYS